LKLIKNMEDSDSNDEALELDIVNSDDENDDNVADIVEQVAPQADNAIPQRMLPFLAHLRRVFRPDAVDDEEGAAAEVSREPAAGPAVRFDSSLPAQHAYLGAGQEVSGRTILDEDLIQSLPLLSMPGFVLVPHQVFPLTLFHPPMISMMKAVLAANRTFGVVNLTTVSEDERRQEEVGTTAEIFEYREENREDVASVGFMLKARGRQRFRVRSVRRQIDGNLVGK
jgi:hypothetical protein